MDVLIVDDSVYDRNRSRKVELLTKIWDHAQNIYPFGFRMLTLGCSDGSTFLPVNSIQMTSEYPEKRKNENISLDKRTAGARQRALSKMKAAEAILELIKAVKTAKTPKMQFGYDGEKLTLTEIYKRNKKRRGCSKYLLSVLVSVEKDGESIPAKVVYVRNRSKRKEYFCLLSADVTLDENEIIRIYGKRWSIEVFLKSANIA